MRVYIAAALTQHAVAKNVAARLRGYGYTVVSTWHMHPDPLALEATLTPVEMTRIADADLDEVRGASALVLLATERDGRAGRWVEFGYALASGIRMFVVSVGADPYVPLMVRGSYVSHYPSLDAFLSGVAPQDVVSP